MDQTSSSSSLFDFNSQAGVMAILVAIRQSSLSAAEKNNLRDLVFLYTNGGGDAGARVALEQKLQAAHISVSKQGTSTAVQTPVAAPAAVLPFGSRRPSPVFVAPVIPGTSTASTVPAPVVAPVVDSPAPAQPVATPTPQPVSDSGLPQTAPVVSLEQEVSAAPSPVAQPVVVPMPATAVTPTPAQAPALEPVAYTDQSNSNHLDRIREIKSAVNGRIGNPVNLVDINNEVGREYMNALLDAMKRLSGGAGQVEPAMQRLELAFASVLKAIDAHEKKSDSPETPVEPVTVPQVAMPESVIAQPVPEVAADLPTIAVVEANSEIEDLAKIVQETTSEPIVTTEAPVVTDSTADDSRWSTPSAPVANVEAKATPYSIGAEPAALVVEKVADLQAEPAPQTKTADSLLSSEVDAGLDQLLSDWVLFKKSGLFGTGPKGREHPLYKKIAHLPIPLLLAGRFEGSTQEIKQSITDYMNGWRYEQGIIYEQGEDFEHYLRRVIRQILDLQKKRRPA